jgi:formamidopyrimidine-DNA glycosylase
MCLWRAGPYRRLPSHPWLARPGPEPLGGAFALSWLREQLSRHGKLGAVHLDQSTVAGLGNVHTGEAPHLAQIHSERLAGTMTAPESRRLHRAVKVNVVPGRST